MRIVCVHTQLHTIANGTFIGLGDVIEEYELDMDMRDSRLRECYRTYIQPYKVIP